MTLENLKRAIALVKHSISVYNNISISLKATMATNRHTSDIAGGMALKVSQPLRGITQHPLLLVLKGLLVGLVVIFALGIIFGGPSFTMTITNALISLVAALLKTLLLIFLVLFASLKVYAGYIDRIEKLSSHWQAFFALLQVGITLIVMFYVLRGV